MARPAKFSTDQILDSARAVVAEHGAMASIAQVAARTGAPVGSIYHRFASREELFTALWVRSIRRFHIGLLDAATLDDPQEALMGVAVHIPRYCRAHPAEARAMTLYRQRALLASAPPSLAEEVRTLNDDVLDAMRALCRRRYGRVTGHRLELLATAVQQCPYGLVRPYVGGEVPSWLDDVVVAATAAILALGDRPRRRT